ncbi:MAG: DUF58 domain-containing protein [Nocardiopsaceae bacterium]|jgi:uncharacterized protein (DUF58 family)|nr:DUF58 domain-containing protein [Nocardiopsaceae bacterium]
MRSVLAWFTVRGASFLAAGIVGILAGLILGSHPMISVGVLLVGLPVFSALTARRARYQLRCERHIVPPRVAPGQPANVLIRLENVSRISTGLLLAEETIPYSLGARPRYVLNGIERGGSREVSYQLRSDLRGKFVVGPMRVRIADVFGLVELTANFASKNTLTVTPKIVPLTSAATTGSWSSDGDGRTRMTAAAGDDDVIPRAYRDGDELRRVHWRSTARYGELMVRREEQRWQDRAVVILDSRRSAHVGNGPSSSFEYAVSAAASIGVHMARAGLDGHLLTDAGPLASPAMFEDVLLDALSVVSTSRNHDFARTTAALSTVEGGLLVLVAGRLSVEAAREIATARRHGRQGIALLLAVSTWAANPARPKEADIAGHATGGERDDGHGTAGPRDARARNGQAKPTRLASQAMETLQSAIQAGSGNGAAGGNGGVRNGRRTADALTAAVDHPGASAQPPGTDTRPGHVESGTNTTFSADGKPTGLTSEAAIAETSAAAAVLRAAGWRVITVDATTPLALAWQQLPRSGSSLLTTSERGLGAGR